MILKGDHVPQITIDPKRYKVTKHWHLTWRRGQPYESHAHERGYRVHRHGKALGLSTRVSPYSDGSQYPMHFVITVENG